MNTYKTPKTNEEIVLITYSEIALKSTPVRRVLESQLARHISNALKRHGKTDLRVRRIQGRLIVEAEDSEIVAKIASKVFGVASAIPAIKVTSRMDNIIGVALEVAQRIIKDNQTFAIRARRVGEQGYTSNDVEVRLGAKVLGQLKSRGVKVNLNNPDVTLYVEARHGDAYIYHKVIDGPAGLPFGSQGKLVGLFSGGIDSPVAAWLMMKRGANVPLLFLDQRPFVGEDYYKRALNVAGKLRHHVPVMNYILNIVPMTEIMSEIMRHVPTKLRCIICKRMMYRIACDLAEKMNAEGIVTGESLGQVASQTAANIRVLDAAATLPVYRPLVGFEKMEIVALAKRIGTYDASTISIHGCSAVPSSPATKAKIGNVSKIEQCLPINTFIENAVKGITRVTL